MLSISVQTHSHLLGKITRLSLGPSYPVKAKHTKLILRRIVIIEYLVVTKKMYVASNIVETKHIDRLLIYEKVGI